MDISNVINIWVGLLCWWCQLHNSYLWTYTLQEDVEKFMSKTENDSVEEVIKRFNEQHQKYKFMELNLNTKKRRFDLSEWSACIFPVIDFLFSLLIKILLHIPTSIHLTYVRRPINSFLITGSVFESCGFPPFLTVRYGTMNI